MRWDRRIIYTRFLAEDFSRIIVRRRSRTRRGRTAVLH